MESTNRFLALTWRAAGAALAVLAVSACAVDKQSAPSLAGPSGFADSLIVTAAPQILSRDGSSMSTISVTARNADGSPAVGRRLLFSATAGTLVTGEVLTGNDGRASVVYIAPSANQPVSSAEIAVTPVEAGDRVNSHGSTIMLELRGPDVPIANFTFAPTDAKVLDLISFDASSSSLGSAACLAGCSYTWDFGDGSSGSGLGASHAYSSAGVFNVTLTVTSLAGGTTGTTTKPVRVALPDAPTAVMAVNPLSPAAGQAITLSSVSVLPLGVSIVRYVWEIDGAAVDTGTTSSYAIAGGFAAATSHQITLTITDNYGRTSRSTATTISIP
ncbi:MAG TPA: PKD domain-containing protein [Vicinamibacterales bacterium]